MSPSQIFKSAWQATCPALSKIITGTNSSPYGICISPFKKAFSGRRHQISGDERSEIVGDLFMKPAKIDWLYNQKKMYYSKNNVETYLLYLKKSCIKK